MSTSKYFKKKKAFRLNRFFFFLTFARRLHFLPDVFDEKTLYLRSSDYIRAQESVQQLIAGGLYPREKRPSDFQLKLHIR